jgi:glycine hydroxymethyltransferase
MLDNSVYNNPLTTRYASKEMQRAFSDDKRFKLWRKLWVALAESQMELGLGVTEEQVAELKEYAEQIVKNAKMLCGVLNYRGFKTVGGMTENHLMTIDLRNSYMCEELTGKDAANLLDKYGITVNKNTVPNDPRGPFVTSGLRIGVPAVTTRGFKEVDMKEVGNIIADILQYHDEKWEDIRLMAKDRAFELCKKYPIYK